MSFKAVWGKIINFFTSTPQPRCECKDCVRIYRMVRWMSRS